MVKRKKNTKIISLVVAICLLFTIAAPVVSAVDINGGKNSDIVYVDGVYDNWALDERYEAGEEVNELDEFGWRRFKASPAAGNNPGATKNPTVFVNEDFQMGDDGYFDITFKSPLAGAKNRFGIYLDYEGTDKGLLIGCDAQGWFWQRYGAPEGPWYTGTRVAPTDADKEAVIHLEWKNNALTVATVNGVNMFSNLPMDFSDMGSIGKKIAIKTGTWGTEITDVSFTNVHYPGQAIVETYSVSGRLLDKATKEPVKDATVSIGGHTAKSNSEGEFEILKKFADGKYELSVTSSDYRSYAFTVELAGGDINVGDIQLESVGGKISEISSEFMTVKVDEKFPRVVEYILKDSGKIIDGQVNFLETISINDVAIYPEVTATKSEDKMEYELKVKDEAKNIDAILTAQISVENNVLAFDITKVVNNLDNNLYPVQKIFIPNHSLISVKSTDSNPKYAGANISTNTRISGDVYLDVTDAQVARTFKNVYGFVSNDEFSAGLWSNSDEGTGAGGGNNNRTSVSVEKGFDNTSFGLGSSSWFYNKKVSAKTETQVIKPNQMPSAKIAIAEDENKNGKIDWQDGAIAFREIMNNPVGSEYVPELVAYRIAMNFGGQAQNPFRETLDNVKKVSLFTDDLGQSVLLKGYGSEGHDSGHPDYYDIGQRIGGADDMNYLLEKGLDYGARFGIHINASEMYPEADAFSEELVRRNADGTFRYGWNWIDQGVGIDGLYDLIMSERKAPLGRQDRLQKLHDLVGNNLDFIYLDVWGNGTSGAEDSWETRYIAQQINDLGWRFTGEWGYMGEYNSNFQHWATDLTYGGFSLKGLNSDIMRFLRNHQKDSWVADYPGYGANAIAPLLGGYNMTDFEGWQGRSNFEKYIQNLYRHDVSTKFLQHFTATEWTDGAELAANYGGTDYKWTPEMEIKLEDKHGNEIVINRHSGDVHNELSKYRSRTITFNGEVILEGEMAAGDWTSDGSEKYLLPWMWDNVTGEKVEIKDEKLYHWNILGGTSEWTLPESWRDLSTVQLYELTELGKVFVKEVSVNDAKIILEDVKDKTPYVVYRGKAASGNEMVWSEGMHIVDAGFNSGHLRSWDITGEGNALITKTQASNPVLKINGEATVSQTLTDLVPGQRYAVLVGVDNRSDSKASVSVLVDGKVVDSNFSIRSVAKNYVRAYGHNTVNPTVDGNSYFQHLYVFFEAPAEGTVTLKLAREAGKGDSYFDDVRVTKTDMNNITYDENGEIVKFEQGFEDSVQGLYPFVVGPIEGTEDNRTHLSEHHAPFTQAGWDVRKGDDVLDGKWSIKVNGLVQRNNLVMQTIPQNFRFEPGKTYDIEFDYQMGSAGIYTLVIGDGEFDRTQIKQVQLEKSLGDTAKLKYSVVGSSSGQTWIGIYSTNIAPDLQGTTSNAANFGGYKEFVLDNLVIQKSAVNKADLSTAIFKATSILKVDYRETGWAEFEAAFVSAKQILEKSDSTQDEIDAATIALNDTMAVLVKIISGIEGHVYNSKGEAVANAEIQLSASNFAKTSIKTDSTGYYKFAEIPVKKYNIRVVTSDYETLRVSLTTVDGETTTKDINLNDKSVGEYNNYFDDGVAMMGDLKGNASKVTAESVDHNGSEAAKIVFPGGGRATIVDTAAPMFENGIFEADVTPLGSSLRFGVVMRGQDMSNQLFTGVGDSDNKYFWESYVAGGSTYSAQTLSDITLDKNETYHLKMEVSKAGKLTLWVDGVVVISGTPKTLPKGAGYLGFTCRNGTAFIVDNISATSYDDKEVSGMIKDNEGSPIADANLKLYNAKARTEGLVAETTSKADGSYTFGKIPSGNYTLKAEKVDYISATAEVAVTSEGVTGAGDISLAYAPGLKALLDKVETLEEGRYTEKSWKALETALALVETIDGTTPSAEITSIITGLSDAIDGLEAEEVDVSLLEFMINDAEALIAEGALKDVLPVVVEKFNTALKVAKETLAKYESAPESVTQDEVDLATNNLIDAIHLLDYKGNKGRLEKLVALSIPYEKDKALYRPATYEPFEIALKAAKDVLADDLAMQEEIDKAWGDLASAVADLRLIPNKDALKKALERAKKYDESLYTEKSFAMLRSSMNEGLDVLGTNDNDIQKRNIDNATNNIDDAINGLVPLADTTTDPTTTDATSDGTGTTTAKEGSITGIVKAAPKTGEFSIVMIITLIAGISLAAVVIVKKGKKA